MQEDTTKNEVHTQEDNADKDINVQEDIVKNEVPAQETSVKSDVQWRPIPSLLKKMDNSDIVTRLTTLRDTCYSMSPTEIHMQFDPVTISESAELYLARHARLVEGFRNALVFAPLMLMLISLGIASQAFIQSPHPTNGTSFFNDWIQGFPSISSVTLLGSSIPIRSGDIHWFTFSDVLIGDFVLLLIIVGLTVIVQLMEGYTHAQTRELTVWLNEELRLLCNASSVRSLGLGPGSEQPEWAVRVHEAIFNLKQVLQGVEGATDISQKNFAKTIDMFTDVYDKQNLAVDKLLRGAKDTEETVDRLGGIYIKLYESSQQVANVLPAISQSLEKMVGYQESMTQQLQSMTESIHQLAEPFRAVGLAEMAKQLDRQQKENLSFFYRLEKSLTEHAAGGWLQRLLSRLSKK